jgi:hypothetical protein
MKKKNFIVLQEEHIESGSFLIDHVCHEDAAFGHFDEIIIPIDRIREIFHFNKTRKEWDYNKNEAKYPRYHYYILFFKDIKNEPEDCDGHLYLTEEGYNYVKGILSSL